MDGRLAILAGGGNMPATLATAYPDALCVAFEGVQTRLPRIDAQHRFEKIGGLFKDMRSQGVTRVVLAGGLARPKLNPAALDMFMIKLAPRFMAALKGGDDALARLVISVFEENGLAVVGAHELLPEITAVPGLLAGPGPSKQNRADVTRAEEILNALSPVDVGQGAVVSNGLVLGIETLQGTDALLRFVAETPKRLRSTAGGILLKRPKLGQDLRVDMPAIGPKTVLGAAGAGLNGIVIAAGQVLLIDRADLIEAANEARIFILAQEA